MRTLFFYLFHVACCHQLVVAALVQIATNGTNSAIFPFLFSDDLFVDLHGLSEHVLMATNTIVVEVAAGIIDDLQVFRS